MFGVKFIGFAIFSSLLVLTFSTEVVKFAAVVYRHGDRTPIDPYPTDPYRDESLWPEKFGELTITGKKQQYALGKYLRTRYSNVISEKFDPTEIYIRSTDVDRTLMSAQTNLAGMYPPTENETWDDNLMWQPIPVHTVPLTDDDVLAMKKFCPTYIKEKARYIQSDLYKKRIKPYTEVMKYLTAYTGRKIRNLSDINDIYNVLYIEELYNFTLPPWSHAVYPSKMREPACYSFFTSTATPLMARLMVGPLLKDIVSKMVTFVTKKSTIKMTIYSGHDLTIANLLSGLGIFDGRCPPYTATIFFDLIQETSNNSYYIRISYKNSTEIIEPHVLAIPHCGEKCPIERFIRLYDSLLGVNWDYECGKSASLVGLSLFLGLGLCALIYITHKIHYIHTSRQRMLTATTGYLNVENPELLSEKHAREIQIRS